MHTVAWLMQKKKHLLHRLLISTSKTFAFYSHQTARRKSDWDTWSSTISSSELESVNLCGRIKYERAYRIIAAPHSWSKQDYDEFSTLHHFYTKRRNLLHGSYFGLRKSIFVAESQNIILLIEWQKLFWARQRMHFNMMFGDKIVDRYVLISSLEFDVFRRLYSNWIELLIAFEKFFEK